MWQMVLLLYRCNVLCDCFCGEGPRSRCYRHTAALRLIVQTCDDYYYFFRFSC
jgi:hypothetical protein